MFPRAGVDRPSGANGRGNGWKRGEKGDGMEVERGGEARLWPGSVWEWVSVLNDTHFRLVW